jgi:hypothetical protein
VTNATSTAAKRWSPAHQRLHDLFGSGPFSCTYCRNDIPCACVRPGAASNADGATVDHATPPRRGGADAPPNTVIACRRCNAIKGTRIWPAEWLPDQEAHTWLQFPNLSPVRTDSLATLGAIFLLNQIRPGEEMSLLDVAPQRPEGPTYLLHQVILLASQGRLDQQVLPYGGSSTFCHVYTAATGVPA